MTEPGGNDLSAIERNELEQYEGVIERGLQTFYEVGQALMEIRDKRLYRGRYDNFEVYCLDRWQITRQRAHQFIEASNVTGNLSTIVDVLPANEAQARPLTRLEPEQQREAWKAVVEAVGSGKITAAHVEATVKRVQAVNQGLLTFPENYRESITKLCGDNDEKISILQRLYKSQGSPETNGTFEEIVSTGGFHYGDDMEKWLNYRQATIEDTRKALDSIVQYHIALNYKRDNKINRAANEYVPQGYDACQTPAYAIDPLLPFLQSNWTIWECAAGEGLLVEAFFDSGFKTVVSSDILTGQNFFEYTPDKWDCIVTNPPYSLKYRWLEHCYQLGKPFALLLPVETLGAKTAHEMFRQHGVEVIFMDKRVNFKMPNKGWEGGGAQFPTAWFTRGLNIGSQMIFSKIGGGDVKDE